MHNSWFLLTPHPAQMPAQSVRQSGLMGRPKRDVLPGGLGQVENVVLVDYQVLFRVEVIGVSDAGDGVEPWNRLLVNLDTSTVWT